MKKYLLIIMILILAIFVININNDEKIILENVERISLKTTTEFGMKEEEMSNNEIEELRKTFNSLNLKPIENNDIKGWQLLLSCYDENGTHMYDICLLNNMIRINNQSYEIEKNELNKLNKYMKTEK